MMESKRCVLVVDDDDTVRQHLVAVLAREGVDVVAVESGPDALAYATTHSVDVILLDVVMPGMDGFETCRRLKADPRTAPIPVIIVSALEASDTLIRGVDAGAEEFVSKPVNPAELRARVRSMLRVKRQLDALVAANQDLVRLRRQHATLSAFLVHDLKSPLSIILMSADAFQDDGLPAEVREAGADVMAAASEMNSMVMDLLDVVRSGLDRLEPNLEAVQVDELVERAVAAIRPLASAKRVAIETTSPAVGTMTGDRELLRRMVTNLLDNGIKYAPAGSTIRLELSLDGARFELRQRDTGAGVCASERERIFDRDARCDSHGNAHGRQGRGLGLAFCRLAAEAHGGRIWVEDNTPSGSMFCVSIPQPPLPSSMSVALQPASLDQNTMVATIVSA